VRNFEKGIFLAVLEATEVDSEDEEVDTFSSVVEACCDVSATTALSFFIYEVSP
jgi:hypothetical protein